MFTFCDLTVNKTRKHFNSVIGQSCIVQQHCRQTRGIRIVTGRADGGIPVPDVGVTQRRTHVALHEEPVDEKSKSRFAARHHSV